MAEEEDTYGPGDILLFCNRAETHVWGQHHRVVAEREGSIVDWMIVAIDTTPGSRDLTCEILGFQNSRFTVGVVPVVDVVSVLRRRKKTELAEAIHKTLTGDMSKRPVLVLVVVATEFQVFTLPSGE